MQLAKILMTAEVALVAAVVGYWMLMSRSFLSTTMGQSIPDDNTPVPASVAIRFIRQLAAVTGSAWVWMYARLLYSRADGGLVYAQEAMLIGDVFLSGQAVVDLLTGANLATLPLIGQMIFASGCGALRGFWLVQQYARMGASAAANSQ